MKKCIRTRTDRSKGLSGEDLEQRKEEILADIEAGEFVSVSNLEREMQLAREAAANFMKKGREKAR